MLRYWLLFKITNKGSMGNQYFNDYYDQMMYTGLVGYFSNHVHKKIKRLVVSRINGAMDKIFEPGCGAGQHSNYYEFENVYIQGDKDKELVLKANKFSLGNKNFLVCDTEKLPFKNNTFSILVATCLLCHVYHLDQAICEWKRVIKKDGTLIIYVPTEPGLALTMIRYFTTTRKGKRMGFDHANQIAKDHRNHYPLMKSTILSNFAKSKIIVHKFPFLPFWHLRLYDIFEIRK
jgi:ubiquinone/menaquinone biosynthesis C-methylase UbiE